MKPLKDVMASFYKKEPSTKKCPTHNENLVIVSVGQRMDEYCESCLKEKIANEDKSLAEETKQHKLKRDTYEVLHLDSIIPDQTILKASFENFIVSEGEESANKQIALDFTKYLDEGHAFNIVIQGLRGSGKSHLAYSILRELNEAKKGYSCLFIAIDEMMRKIRGSFRDKESKYTEDYFISLLSKVDFLVLDDLGAETGAIDTDKEASNFVQRVLYGVMNARQSKATIFTTNLSSQVLKTMYDEKLLSRITRSKKFIIFKNTKDKRGIDNLPF